MRTNTSYKKIHMPKNTGAGAVISGFILVLGFAMIWHIWWLAIAAAAGSLISAIVHTFNRDRDYYVSAEEVARIEQAHQDALAQATKGGPLGVARVAGRA